MSVFNLYFSSAFISTYINVSAILNVQLKIILFYLKNLVLYLGLGLHNIHNITPFHGSVSIDIMFFEVLPKQENLNAVSRYMMCAEGERDKNEKDFSS